MTISDYMRLCGRGPEERPAWWEFSNVDSRHTVYTGPGHDLLTNWTREGDDAVLCAGLGYVRKAFQVSDGGDTFALIRHHIIRAAGPCAEPYEALVCNDKPGLALFNAIVEVHA